MENNKAKSLSNTLVTDTFSWPILAELAGVCLMQYSYASPIIEGDAETLAEEIALQIAHQAQIQGQDPADTKARTKVEFTAPVWAVCFIASILAECPDADIQSGFYNPHMARLARKALAVMEDKEQDPDELPGFRLN
jgi:hypothetical protein